jgi:hypothetical protein
VIDQEIQESQVNADRFPFPCEGDITLAVRNANYALGPVMLHIVMKPGSVIPAHLHEGVVESGPHLKRARSRSRPRTPM